MESNEQVISCPNCGTPITFNAKALLSGQQFSCMNCKSEIGIAAENKNEVQDVMRKFNELKNNQNNKK